VVNQPTDRTIGEVFDQKLGQGAADVPLFWGGPVQPQAVLALVRAARPGPHARTIVPDVQLTRDLDDVKSALAARDGPLRVRVFSGYAGWGPDQLATEVRHGAWVLEPADAASVFTPEPSSLWERVREIVGRVVAERRPSSGGIGKGARHRSGQRPA
jgi:putative transcriptional regulator